MARQSVIPTIHDLISQDIENTICIDCKSQPTSHISITHGSFICSSCAETHHKLGEDISKIKTIDELITENEAKMMMSGGNNAFTEFLKYYGLLSTQINFKYNTRAAYFYRYMIKKISADQEVDIEMPGQIEGTEIVVKTQPIDLNSTNIAEPLLSSEENVSNSLFTKMFRCFYVTSNKISEKVGNKFKNLSEKSSVKEAEHKTKEIIEKFGKGVENTVNSVVASGNFQKAKSSIEKFAQRIKGDKEKLTSSENNHNISASTVSLDEAEVVVLDDSSNLS